MAGTEDNRYAATMLGSAVSGMLARIPCHPLDTVKARLQVQTGATHTSPYKNFAQALGAVFRSEGIRGLYRGIGITFFGSAPASVLYFTTYEWSKDRLAASRLPLLQVLPSLGHFAAGMMAEIVSCLLWVPIDVIKERMQVQRVEAAGTIRYYSSTSDAVRKIMSTEGIRGIYRGYGATIASFGPFSALYFMLYEQCKGAVMRHRGTSEGDQLPFGWQLATACLAGGGASLLTNPLDLTKLRLQVQRASGGAGDAVPFQYRNMWHGLQLIVAEEGWRALLRGAGARIAYHAPATAITMTLFERCKGVASHLLYGSELN